MDCAKRRRQAVDSRRLCASRFRWWRSSAVLSGLLACSVSIAWAQGPASQPPLPAPGHLVDVGGWRLHLHCTGEAQPGQPTVVLEAGLGDFSVEWSLVQPPVAAFARVCSYDRAGDGWSELGPHPRTLRQITYELHVLLERSGERPPYVLVGHSYGGWLVRQYQLSYPAEVAGLVLVDPGATDPQRLMPDGRTVRSSELVRGRQIPAVKESGPLRINDIPPAALQQMTAGLEQASANANAPPRDRLPEAARRMRTWALGQIGHVAAAVNPFEAEELASLRMSAAGRPFPLDDLPIVVISRGIPDAEDVAGLAEQEERVQDHASVAAMSRSGRHMIAEESGHHVQLEQPELVVRAIREVVVR